MGLDAEHALGAVRLSVGRWTTEADIEVAAAAVIRAANGFQHTPEMRDRRRDSRAASS